MQDKEMFPHAVVKEMYNMAEGVKTLLKERHQAWKKISREAQETPRQGWYRSSSLQRFMSDCEKLQELGIGNLRVVHCLRGVVFSPTLRNTTDHFVKEQFTHLEQFLLRQFHEVFGLTRRKTQKEHIGILLPGISTDV